MSIIAVDLSDGKKKGIVLRKKNHLYEVVDYNINKKGRFYISIFFQDFITATTVLPPAKDKKTIELLIRNKLSGQLEKGTSYSLVYKERGRLGEKQIEYIVYALPERVFYEVLEKLDISDDSYIETFSISQLSLAGISRKISENETIFMVYADREKFIVTVSKGSDILYTRSTKIPEYADNEEQLVNFYYENLNLTYIYAVQNRSINIDSIALSGNISRYEQFVNLAYNFSNKPVYTVLPQYFIKDVNIDQFNEMVIPIGNILIGKEYDFSPQEIKEKRIFNRLTEILISILIFVFLIITGLNFSLLFNLKEKYTDVKLQYENLIRKLEKDIASKNLSKNEILYLSKYAGLLDPEKKIINILSEITNLLFLIKNENLNITNIDNKTEINIKAVQTFKSIGEIENFKRKYYEYLSKLKKFKVIDKTVFDLNNMKASINLEIIRENVR
ncbi:hypothetical protein [Persephonella sp.]